MSEHDYSQLVSQVPMQHEPIALLTRAVLQIDDVVRQQGVFLSFVNFEELLHANQAHSSTWLPIVAIFDCRFSQLDDATAFCILGRNRGGEIVACQAARLLDWPNTNFWKEAQ